MEPQEDPDPVFRGLAPPDAELYVEIRTSTDIRGRTKPDVRIYGNRASMQWLAYRCLHMSYASPAAIESGYHQHLEDYKYPSADWPANLSLEIASSELIQKLRQQHEGS